MATDTKAVRTSMDWLAFESKLLSSRSLRAEFERDRVAVAESMGLSESDLPLVRDLDLTALGLQAGTLVNKRYAAVADLLPVTSQAVGPAMRGWFEQYADTFWPEGHQRHLLDALRFHAFLMAHKVAGVCRAERHLLRFRLDGGRLRIRFAMDVPIGYYRHAGVMILRRRGANVRCTTLHVAPGRARTITGGTIG